MLQKNKSKNLFYIDRDSNAEAIYQRMIISAKEEIIAVISDAIANLQEKEAGEYRTVEFTTSVMNLEMQNLQQFFRGAVIPYYARQHYDHWGKLPKELVEEVTKYLKVKTGFILYDHEGKPNGLLNSTLSFAEAKQFANWLNEIENVCFIDEGYIFPNSEHFNGLVKQKGLAAAQAQVIDELRRKHLNRFNQNI